MCLIFGKYAKNFIRPMLDNSFYPHFQQQYIEIVKQSKVKTSKVKQRQVKQSKVKTSLWIYSISFERTKRRKHPSLNQQHSPLIIFYHPLLTIPQTIRQQLPFLSYSNSINLIQASFKMRASCSYLVLYMISCFFTAMPLGSVDALVPFMAHRAHTDQSEYSNIYTIIGFALLAGAIVQKALSMYKLLPNHHTIMVIGNLGIAVFSMIITLMDSRDTQYIAWSVLKIFNYFFMVSTNNSLINASSREEIGQWIAFSHGAQGFGTLFGSIITEYMGMNMFYIVAAGCVLITPFFLCMESPEKIQKTPQEQAIYDRMQPCSRKLGYIMCVCVFLAMGIQSTIQDWIASYALVKSVSTSNTQAVFFTYIFIGLESLFRFIFGYMGAADSSKFKASSWGQLLAGVVCFILTVAHMFSAATYLSSILYGIGLAMIWPMILSAPKQFGLRYEPGQVSNVMIASAASALLYSNLTGTLMDITPDMYHYSLLVYSIIVLVVVLWVMDVLSEEGREGKGFEQIPAGV